MTAKKLPIVQQTAPERIWLAVADDAYYADKPFPDAEEVCWSSDAPLEVCVPYVRADLATLAPEASGAAPWIKESIERMSANPATPTSDKLTEIDDHAGHVNWCADKLREHGYRVAANGLDETATLLRSIRPITPADESGAAEDAELPSAQGWLDSHCSVASRDWQRGWDAAREALAARRARGESNEG